MKTAENYLRRFIKEEVSKILEDNGAPSVGKDIKGGAAADKAADKISGNPVIQKSLDQITTADGLASFLQDIIKAASEKGIDQNEIKGAVKKIASAVSSAK